jgi:hypothetical protein
MQVTLNRLSSFLQQQEQDDRKGQQAFARKRVFAAPMPEAEIRSDDVVANFGDEWKPT